MDRNLLYSIIAAVDPNVALLAEGVDRNIKHFNGVPLHRLSPSSRRAWIEILQRLAERLDNQVALLAEGVDRNLPSAWKAVKLPPVALLAEGVDRNFTVKVTISQRHASPSSRRAWIEITFLHNLGRKG